jgi:hypothetical protein
MSQHPPRRSVLDHQVERRDFYVLFFAIAAISFLAVVAVLYDGPH